MSPTPSFLIDSPSLTLVPLHLSTPTDSTGRRTFSVSWYHLVALDTKASLSQEKQYTQATHDDLPYWTANPPKRTWKDQTHTPLTYTFLPCLPPCVSRPRTGVLLDSGSSVLHGQLLHCRGLQLLCILLQNGRRHDPRDFILANRTIVVPVGIIVYSTLSIPVFSFWIDMLIIVTATAVHRFVSFWEVNVLWLVYFLRSGCFM